MNTKPILGSLIMTSVLLAGCTMPWSKDTSSLGISGTDSSSLPSSQQAMATPTLEDCKKATDAYLTQAKEAKTDATVVVKNGTNLTVNYIGRLADGSVFDTSVESVAKACGMYTAQRDYTKGLPFVVGAGQMIAGFDKAVVGMLLNETKTVTIPAAEAYGADTVSIPLSELPTKSDGTKYVAGDSIMTMNGAIKIESMNDKEFTIKNNHPLAGKDLIFDITVVSAQ